MADAKLVAGLGEGLAPVGAAVVGQDALDRHAVTGVEAPRATQERRGRLGGLVGELLGICQAAVIIDRQVDLVPADPAVANRL